MSPDLNEPLQVFVDEEWKDCSKVSNINTEGQMCVSYENNQLVVVEAESRVRNKPQKQAAGDLWRRVREGGFDEQATADQNAKKFMELAEKAGLIKIL